MVMIVSAVAACVQPALEQDQDGLLLRAILPPESLGRHFTLSQQVVGEFRSQKQGMRFEVEVTPTRVVMVGLTHIGVPVFSLEQEAGGIEVETFGVGQLPFNPRHILSDFQIAYWPASLLRRRFKSFGLQVKEVAADGSRSVLARNGEVLVQVTYLDKASGTGDIVVDHFDHLYRLHIRTIEASGSWQE